MSTGCPAPRGIGDPVLEGADHAFGISGRPFEPEAALTNQEPVLEVSDCGAEVRSLQLGDGGSEAFMTRDGRSLRKYELDREDDGPRCTPRGSFHIVVGLDLRGSSLARDREGPPDSAADRYGPLVARAGLPVRRYLRPEGEVPVLGQENVEHRLEEHRVHRGSRGIAGI